jgi:hypothetical protein
MSDDRLENVDEINNNIEVLNTSSYARDNKTMKENFQWEETIVVVLA